MRALVTGGAGFIGHHLVRGLLDRGADVRVLDDFSTGTSDRLAPFGGAVTLIEGSILDRPALDQAMAGCDVVFHLAAIASVVRSMAEPRLTEDVNVGGTIEVAESAARQGTGRVVFASSSAVYGASEGVCRESQREVPESPYGASKLAAEQFLRTVGAARGVATVSLRYFNVFGPRQDPASEYAAVIPRFVVAALSDTRPTIFGDGLTTRDFVYVDDVVTANVLAADPSAPSGLACNIATGEETSLHDLLRAIGAVVGQEIEPGYAPERAGDIARSRAEVSLAERELGYRVTVPFREGIARTIDSYRSPAAA